MKTKYSVQVIDVKFQVDYVTPKRTKFLTNMMKYLLILIYMLS